MAFDLPTENKGLLGPDWLAESIRVTAFSAYQGVPTPLWAKLVDADPKEVMSRPHEGVLTEVGDFGVGNLVVNQIPGRLDIMVAASPQQSLSQLAPFTDGGLSDLVHIGPSSAALGSVLHLIRRGVALFKDPYRIGFAPIFLKKVKSNQDANETILRYEQLPIRENDTDIIWRVNRSKPAESFEGRINRVINWQTSRLLTQRILIGQPAGIQMPQIAGNTYFVRLELDVNTFQPENLPPTPFQNWQEVSNEVFSSALHLITSEQ